MLPPLRLPARISQRLELSPSKHTHSLLAHNAGGPGGCSLPQEPAHFCGSKGRHGCRQDCQPAVQRRGCVSQWAKADAGHCALEPPLGARCNWSPSASFSIPCSQAVEHPAVSPHALERPLSDPSRHGPARPRAALGARARGARRHRGPHPSDHPRALFSLEPPPAAPCVPTCTTGLWVCPVPA